MEFAINKSVLGTEFNLICSSDGEVTKSEWIQTNILDTTSKRARFLARIYGFKIPEFPSIKFQNSMEIFRENLKTIPWHSIMPLEVYRQELKGYIKELQNTFGNLDISYIESVYDQQTVLFESLMPAKIDVELYSQFLENKFGEQDSIKTFTPNHKGYADKVFYDRIGSKTGRLTVFKGPHILNLKTEYRDILKSRFGTDGKVYYLDFSSLEPRVLLAINGQKDIPEDIYSFVSSEIGGNLPREAIKQVLLTKIYGGSDDLIINNLKKTVATPEDVIKLIVEYFRIDELRKNLSQQYYDLDGEKIYNKYGRPILCKETPAYKLINYYVQSTSVDVALFGFTNMIKRIRDAGLVDEIVPIFILHDGIFLDVHNKHGSLLEKISKAGSVGIKGFENIDFHLKTERIFM